MHLLSLIVVFSLRFAAKYDSGDDEVKGSIIYFAGVKLLCRMPSRSPLTPAETLACPSLAVRLGSAL